MIKYLTKKVLILEHTWSAFYSEFRIHKISITNEFISFTFMNDKLIFPEVLEVWSILIVFTLNTSSLTFPSRWSRRKWRGGKNASGHQFEPVNTASDTEGCS